MTPNGELTPQWLEIPAKIYPGMFERELQATIEISGKEVTVIVSRDDVVLEKTVSPVLPDTGVPGKLLVSLLDEDDETGLLISLPGEPLGFNRRFRVGKEELKAAQ